MATTRDLYEQARQGLRRGRRFVRSYTDGLSSSDVRRLFDRDAPQAYAVLTRDQAEGELPSREVARFFFRARLFLLGLTAKLTPPRRLLFAVAMVGFVLGFLGVSFRFGEGSRITIDFSPLWFSLSVACLVFLLALELVDRIRVRDELEVARELQRDLLPCDVPLIPGYRLAHSYRTANEVGGDYYDFPLLADGRVVVMMGDASGHGMAAGLLMAIANATIRTALDLDPSPPKVTALLNRALFRTGGSRAFMTFFYGLLEPGSGRFEYVCAGHPFPLLRRAGGGVEELGEGGYPLGLRPDLAIAARRAQLSPGDLLLLYTDGLAEGVNAAGEPFGFARIQSQLEAGGGASLTHDSLLYAFDRHRGDTPLTDDVSVVVVEREPPPPPPPPVPPPAAES